jgi:hypothetical protein
MAKERSTHPGSQEAREEMSVLVGSLSFLPFYFIWDLMYGMVPFKFRAGLPILVSLLRKHPQRLTQRWVPLHPIKLPVELSHHNYGCLISIKVLSHFFLPYTL